MRDTIYRDEAIEAVAEDLASVLNVSKDETRELAEHALSALPSAEPSLKAIKRQIDEHWYLAPSAEASQNLAKPNKELKGSDVISRDVVLANIDERLRANGYGNVGLVSELNRLVGYVRNIPSAEAVQGKESGSKLDLISRELAMERIAKDNVVGGMERINEYNNSTEFNEYLDGISDAITTIFCDVPSADAVQGWIPFKKRPLTDEEKQEYPDWTYIFDCPLPYDEEEILLSNGKYVWTDTFINDGECYLDSGDDIDDGMAWMPLPKPYKGGDDE